MSVRVLALVAAGLALVLNVSSLWYSYLDADLLASGAERQFGWSGEVFDASLAVLALAVAIYLLDKRVRALEQGKPKTQSGDSDG